MSNEYSYLNYLIQSLSTRSSEHVAESSINALQKIKETVYWLDSTTTTGLPPFTSQDIEKLLMTDIKRYAEDIIDTILGRLYLLEGNARLASETFRRFLAHHPEQVRWYYYALWADMLSGSYERLAQYWKQLSDWSGRWSIACLLLDIDPTLDKQLGLRATLKKDSSTSAYASVIQTRLALIDLTASSVPLWYAGQGSIEEDIEALRTSLGYAFYITNCQKLAHLMAIPLFQRLPKAEQQLWKGLHLLSIGQHSQGEALLEQTAMHSTHPRAALVLATHFLKQNRHEQARILLSQVAPVVQKHPKIQLLHTSIDAIKPLRNDMHQPSVDLAKAETNNLLSLIHNAEHKHHPFYIALADRLKSYKPTIDAPKPITTYPLSQTAQKQLEKPFQLVNTLIDGNIEKVCGLLFEIWKNNTQKIDFLEITYDLALHCCAYALKRRNSDIPPQIVTILQKQQQTVKFHAKNSKKNSELQKVIVLARALLAIGQTEQAYQLWSIYQETISTTEFLRNEFIDLLCYQAVNAWKHEERIFAIKKLCEARDWSTQKKQQEQLERIAKAVELEMAVHRLLKLHIPNIATTSFSPGRYHVFKAILEQNPPLKKALVQDKIHPETIRNLWTEITTRHLSDAKFIHIRTVLYWDSILLDLTAQKYTEWKLKAGTTLWLLLLCTDDFWAYFSEARMTNVQGERVELTQTLQDDLFHDAVDYMLSLHVDYASRAFAEQRYAEAKIHLHLLYLCHKGQETLLNSLTQWQLAFALPINSERLADMTKQAARKFNGWWNALLEEAKRATEAIDPSERTRKNYRAGIEILRPFIEMQIPVPHILTTSLGWYNNWCADLWNQAYTEVFRLNVFATPIAEQLIPLCRKEQSFKPDAQALSLYFMWCGLISSAMGKSKEERIADYKMALEWNPFNNNARKLLEEDLKNA